ncbi:MAG: hypothetical protein AAF402_05495 [Pseudomonadota bacterium]
MLFISARIDDVDYASVNANALSQDYGWAKNESISPKSLSRDEKLARWKQRWIRNVCLPEIKGLCAVNT